MNPSYEYETPRREAIGGMVLGTCNNRGDIAGTCVISWAMWSWLCKVAEEEKTRPPGTIGQEFKTIGRIYLN